MKRFLTFILIILMILSLASCANPDNNYNGTPSDDDDVKDNNDNDADDEDDDNNSNQSQETEGKYSTFLQNVLNNAEYNALIEKPKTDVTFVKSAYFDPHPYAFLVQQGHNVQAIKNGTNECYTLSYGLDEEPNYLYMATRVNENNISTNYLLKYKLTDKEMEDYKFIQGDSTFYIQTAFINDEISRIKTPESVKCVKISTQQQEQLDNRYENRSEELKNADSCNIIIANINADNSFEAVFIPKIYDNDSITHQSEVLCMNIKSLTKIKVNTDIITIGDRTLIQTQEEKSGTFYFSQDVDLVSAKIDLASN